MEFDKEKLSQEDKRYRATLINSVSGFKSVALIGTRSPERITNLGVFSQIIHIGANPPLVGVLFRPDVVPRHTLDNILKTKSFTINHLNKSILEKSHHTAARWEESEFSGCDFTEEDVDGVFAPFVEESQVKIGCEFREKIDLSINGTHLVIGEIVKLIVPSDCILSDGYVNLQKAGSLSSAGLDAYFESKLISRFSYPKPNTKPTKLD